MLLLGFWTIYKIIYNLIIILNFLVIFQLLFKIYHYIVIFHLLFIIFIMLFNQYLDLMKFKEKIK